ncbi:interferon alpha-inducible protein 27, mitochondrial isoform X2 [Cricetulus griseus]|uniref:Interferon alpha-inducible protein 27, mitochondrial isoform X2 n=1 Tax=Cricetulus griseus TaxID=10029 RepID=A0A9J7JTC7_CRIGR|nr:interferon alpha-inducible protein 27, mitochondrial isoform X2 [Cricetulus griseus]XP_027274991.1 interferon alpha-inducible protein 27, mitochondrial isoform X2 [Cricetulus griseus]
MAWSGAGTLVVSLFSKITASAAMVKAGGAVSGTILAGTQGLNLLAQTALGSGASALGSSLGALKVGTILSACPASVLAVGPSAAMTVAAVPPVLSAVGFTGPGIVASSLAAKMMSLSAIANGGGVAAGGLVATLQSVGAAGLSMQSQVLLGSAGTALVASVMGICGSSNPSVPREAEVTPPSLSNSETDKLAPGDDLSSWVQQILIQGYGPL